jgi:hypothetical protein
MRRHGMKVLTASQVENLNNFIDDDTIGNIMQFAANERTFITDKRIEKALRNLADDVSAPRRFNGLLSLYNILKTRGLKSSWPAFCSRILPTFETKATNWKSFFNDDTYILASMFFEPGYLDMEVKEKLSKTSRERWNSEEYRDKQSKISKEYWNNPDNREKLSEIAKERWNNPDIREKRLKIIRERHRCKRKSTDEVIEKAIDKLPSPSETGKMSLYQIIRMICDIDKSLNSGTVRSRFYKSHHFNETIYNRICPYLKTMGVGAAVPAMTSAPEISASHAEIHDAINKFMLSNSR